MKVATRELLERWENQCEAMFGKGWKSSNDFLQFYEDFRTDIIHVLEG